MSVPLDRLYNYLDDLCNHDALIYRFYPHGSKNPESLLPLHHYTWYKKMTLPVVVCNDQEPLNYDFYKNFSSFLDSIVCLDDYKKFISKLNLRGITTVAQNMFDSTVLVHSEKNSQQLALYEQHQYVGAYWWSHAAIARDWYRYAEVDPLLLTDFQQIQKDFLIYNRAWSGSREYRLTFVNMLINHDLVEHCDIKFNPVCNNVHYTQHQWQNKQLQVFKNNLENFYELNNADSSASADYSSSDYLRSAIEVVLETLFDDQRHHLTEKILRPIATGRPFILASTQGSLLYLKSYGFKSFSPYINEEYDNVADPILRLKMITAEMKRISVLSPNEKINLWTKLYQIADYNKQLFFSNSWHASICDELKTNLNLAVQKCLNGSRLAHWNHLQKSTHHGNIIGTMHAESKEIEKFIKFVKDINL
jgi:hypothetical protein